MTQAIICVTFKEFFMDSWKIVDWSEEMLPGTYRRKHVASKTGWNQIKIWRKFDKDSWQKKVNWI
jgi:hypothetical protein